MKRFFDIAATIILIPVWGVVVAVAAVVIFLTDGSPIFFVQERAGLGGKVFRILKFRTMKTGCGPDCARITKLGAFLRKTSIDELPQLFNVLRGEMSIVGPRPLPSKYLPRYSREQARRHLVRPGITGWAQVNGRNAIGWDEKFRLDIWYVENRSLLLDLKIILMTLKSALLHTGINSSSEETMPEFMGVNTLRSHNDYVTATPSPMPVGSRAPRDRSSPPPLVDMSKDMVYYKHENEA